MSFVHLGTTVLHDENHRNRTYHHLQIWLYADKVMVRGYYRGALYPLFRVATLTDAVELARKVNRKHQDLTLRGPGVAA